MNDKIRTEINSALDRLAKLGASNPDMAHFIAGAREAFAAMADAEIAAAYRRTGDSARELASGMVLKLRRVPVAPCIAPRF
jgi:uncharacterized protein YggE